MKIKTIFKLFPGLIFIFCLLAISFNLPIFAQSTNNCGGGTPARAEGLVTSPSRTGKFSTSGACIDNNSKVVFAFFKIPTYADLISIYYDQSKLTKNTVSTFPTSFGADGIYKTSGDLTVGGNPTGSGTEVIFVEGNLNITSNLIYHTNDTLGGLVFMVKGDVIISSTITQVDAIIIVQGKIYTAGSGCAANSVTTPSALTVNGSFISLNQIDSSPIKFCRKLTDNNLPAEIINHQVKYLVLLRSLISDTLQKWSEIDASIPLPTPGPTSAPSPTPTPTPTPTPSCVATSNTACLPITVKVVKTSSPTPSPWPTCQYIAGGCKNASSTCVAVIPDASNCAVDPIRGDYTWCNNASYTLSCFPTDMPNPPIQGVANIATYATCTAHLGSLGDSTASRSGTTDANGNIVLTVPVETSSLVNATCFVSINATSVTVLYNVSRDWEYPNQFISPPIPQISFGSTLTQTYNLTWYAGGGANYPRYVIQGFGLNAIFVLQGP